MNEEKLKKRKNKALEEGNDSLLIDVTTDLANLYMKELRYDAAISEYLALSVIYENKNKLMDCGIINRGIAEAYSFLTNFDKALHHLQIYLEAAKKMKNKLEEQRALATIGHIYLTKYLHTLSDERDKNALNLALKFCSSALLVCENLTNEVGKWEIADMSARLFHNLGLIQEAFDNYDKAIELLRKSINLCKVHEIYEQLSKGYISIASVFEKKGDRKSALQHCNLAVETAERKVKVEPELMCTALSSKMEVLLKLGDIRGAKQALLKAYKLRIRDKEEQHEIERKLRLVAAWSLNEDKLLVTKDTDHKEIKLIYEKMGDAASELRHFDKALEYYQKMLEQATKADCDQSELSLCYTSIAATYNDLGQFDESLRYYETDFEMSNNYNDRFNSLWVIITVKETANHPMNEVQAVYEKALQYSQNEGNEHDEGKILRRYISYLQRNNGGADKIRKLQKKLDDLDYESSGPDSPHSRVGDEIDLDNITDMSDTSDTEPNLKSRRRSKQFSVKRNAKGETQLHTACINGKMNVVRHLLDQGHPVNVRDHCGWLPLHEACIWGHQDIVNILLESGAAINDRGGTHCNGITPLHDAASNGHLTIVELLLNKGANAVAKTDDGDTVLDYLKIWRKNTDLDHCEEDSYRTLVNRLITALEKSGHSSTLASAHSILPSHSISEEKAKTRKSNESTSPANKENMRRSKCIGLDDDESLPSDTRPVNEYRSIMQNLRRKSETLIKTKSFTELSKKPALIDDDGFKINDDWLEDDLGNNSSKKRKKRLSSSPEKTKPKISKLSSFTDISMDWNSPEADLFEKPNPMLIDNESDTHINTTQSKHKSKHQAKLTNFSYKRIAANSEFTHANRTENDQQGTSSTSISVTSQPEERRTVHLQSVMDPVLSIDVKINEKLYRVPVLLSQVGTHTMKWLAEEAANRYAKKEYMKPTLELQTKNGAILVEDDLISLLFPMGTSQSEQVEARIIKWNIPPLTDRYKEACKDMNVVPDQTLCDAIEGFSAILDLSNQAFKSTTLAPLWKALNGQINLLELDVSANFLSLECIQFLASRITVFQSLSKLNLSCTGIGTEHVQILANKIDQSPLWHLNLSDNFIDDRCIASLVACCGKLKYLNLSLNKFSKDAFKSFQGSGLSLEHLECIDLSQNGLSNDSIIKFISWLNPALIQSIDVSNNSATPGLLREILSILTKHAGFLNLVAINVSRCCLHDGEVTDLLRICNRLKKVNLSYNPGITGISLTRVLEHETIQDVNVYGCKEVLKYYDFFSFQECRGKVSLKLDFNAENSEGCEILCETWRKCHGERAKIERDNRFISLSTIV